MSDYEKKESEGKYWMFTINNPENNDFENIECVYMIWQLEIGENGTPHVQGYVCFATNHKFNRMKILFPLAHLELRRGKHSEAKGYCSKKDTRVDGPYELGDDSDIAEGKGHRCQMIEIRNKIDNEVPESTIWQENFGQYSRYYKAFREYKKVTQVKRLTTVFPLQHEWFYGESGTGKSRFAREKYPNAYIKMCNKWWDDYAGQDVVILEDFDKNHYGLCHHLKIWGDGYPFPAEHKGGKSDIRPVKVIITSNWHPSDIWTDKEDLEPILRRFKVKKFHRSI